MNWATVKSLPPEKIVYYESDEIDVKIIEMSGME